MSFEIPFDDLLRKVLFLRMYPSPYLEQVLQDVPQCFASMTHIALTVCWTDANVNMFKHAGREHQANEGFCK